MGGRLAREIRQTRPFGSLAEEAILNVERTASVLAQAVAEALKPHGLSEAQYNVLRILRGAGPRGCSCQEIAERLVARDPDVTRLLDRLEARGLIGRARSPEDRRVVVTRLSASGAGLLAGLDAPLRALPGKLLGHLGDRKLRALIDLLEQARRDPRE
jgi:DNA-binding MarR family transcriptional regulator